jgi:hypothetical protein
MFTVALSVGVISWAEFLSAYYMAGCFYIVLLLCSAAFLFLLFLVLCACCEGNLFGCSAKLSYYFPDVQETFEVAYLDSDSFAMCPLAYLATHNVDADAASMASSVDGLCCMRLRSNSASLSAL